MNQLNITAPDGTVSPLFGAPPPGAGIPDLQQPAASQPETDPARERIQTRAMIAPDTCTTPSGATMRPITLMVLNTLELIGNQFFANLSKLRDGDDSLKQFLDTVTQYEISEILWVLCGEQSEIIDIACLPPELMGTRLKTAVLNWAAAVPVADIAPLATRLKDEMVAIAQSAVKTIPRTDLKDDHPN